MGLVTELLGGLFAGHRADPTGTPIHIGQLNVVCDGGDWVVALDNHDAFYQHMNPDGRGPFESDPSDQSDWCMDCNTYFNACEETGRTYCGCGFWYERYFWNL